MATRGPDLFKPYNDFAGFGKWNIPVIKKQDFDVADCKWIPFNYCRSYKESRKYRVVHYYIHDHLFERVWNTRTTLHWTLGYRATLTPDFSTYTDTPLAFQMWNIFRSRYIGAYCQQKLDMNVITTLQWSNEDSLEFAFDGIEKGCAVALNTLGIEKQNVTALHLKCFKHALDVIEPSVVYMYGGLKDWYPDYNYVEIEPYYKEIERARLAKREEEKTNVH